MLLLTIALQNLTESILIVVPAGIALPCLHNLATIVLFLGVTNFCLCHLFLRKLVAYWQSCGLGPLQDHNEASWANSKVITGGRV